MWEQEQEPTKAGTAASEGQDGWRQQAESGESGAARLGKRIKLKGEIRGREDLYIDGEADAAIDLKGNHLTLGPNAVVRAEVTVRSITIEGRLQGKLNATTKTVIRSTGSFEGELVTARIVVEDGAGFRGTVDIVKPEGESDPLLEKEKNSSASDVPTAAAAGQKKHPSLQPVASA